MTTNKYFCDKHLQIKIINSCDLYTVELFNSLKRSFSLQKNLVHGHFVSLSSFGSLEILEHQKRQTWVSGEGYLPREYMKKNLGLKRALLSPFTFKSFSEVSCWGVGKPLGCGGKKWNNWTQSVGSKGRIGASYCAPSSEPKNLANQVYSCRW